MLNTIKIALNPSDKHTDTNTQLSTSQQRCTQCHANITNTQWQYCCHCGTKLNRTAAAAQHTHDTAAYDTSSKHVWRKLGILGGGQLGRMLAQACADLNIHTTVLDPSAQCSARAVANEHIVGSFRDAAYIKQLCDTVDCVTVEIEHVDTHAIAQHASAKIQPTVDTIQLIQDKYRQKQHLQQHGIPLGQYCIVRSRADIHAAIKQYSLPLMLKSRLLAYDGRGNYVLRSEGDIDNAIAALTANTNTTDGQYMLYAEQWVDYTMELSVMVVRSQSGAVRSYPTVQTIQHDSICHIVIAPAPVDSEMQQAARTIAENAISTMSGAGIYGVELFLLRNDTILLNEIAPRVHNSGHYTTEACHTSQFENHVRAVMNLPLGSTAMRCNYAVMVNVLGTGDTESSWLPCAAALQCNGAVHWYGKQGCAAKRKIGHITWTGNTYTAVVQQIAQWQHLLDTLGKQHSVDHTQYIHTDLSKLQRPLVGIIMGSDSDIPKMSAAADILDRFNIAYEFTIVSAHRTPDRLMQYARSAHGRGLLCIIAGAGGAAHLPGMVAAMTSLPVIGVPVPLTHLDGVDSLYSIVQMPRGVPVATVAIGNSTNAGLLALRVLALTDAALYDQLMQYQSNMTAEVNTKIDKLQQTGWKQYTAK